MAKTDLKTQAEMQKLLATEMIFYRHKPFKFIEDKMGLAKADCLDKLKGKTFKYKDKYGETKEAMLFDENGFLVHSDLSIYKQKMFKHQTKKAWKKFCKGKQLTWQQTLEVEAYRRGIQTFNQDSYELRRRFISICSGHGIGKSSFLSIISLHFLICFQGAQIGATANTRDQLEDVLLKEFFFWRKRLPEYMSMNINQIEGMIKVMGQKDWFLRARVASPDKPEALAGLHGDYVMLIVDEASGVSDNVFEVMYGALTGENFIVIYTSNPTRTEGEFYDSHHKNKHKHTCLQFSSMESPIVKDAFMETMEKYEKDSDEWKIRVLGQFASTDEMNDKGWIPLFANLKIMFEPDNGQIIHKPIIGVDPAGQGRDETIITVRDTIYMKQVLSEKTSTPVDTARKVETVRDAYRSKSVDIGVDGFGIGAQVVANIRENVGEKGGANAILTDKPREEAKDRFTSYKSELAWKFREWVAGGGIIITNQKQKWLDDLSKIKFKRDLSGKIKLMSKVEFKKEYGYSPDRFDSGLYTFFRDEPTRPVVKTKKQLEQEELDDFIRKAQGAGDSFEDYSSM